MVARDRAGYDPGMRRLSSVLVMALLAAVSACGSSNKPVARIRLSPKGIFDEAVGSIVRVEAGGDKLGTGFIVDKSGIVATNLHVIAGESEIKVRLHDGSSYPVLQIAGLDPGHDLALLKIRPKQELPAVRLGDSNAVGPGDQVVAIGNPLGVLDNTVSQGLVGAVRVLCSDKDVVSRAAVLAKIGKPVEDIARELSVKKARTNEEDEILRVLGCNQELTVLQISVPISQGSSGGPLFNQYGEVIGVTTAIITAGQSLNLAMPSKYLKPLVQVPSHAMELDVFAKLTKEQAEHADSEEDTSIPRREVPDLGPTTWDGCQPKDIDETVAAIMSAIDIGAPAYNKLSKQGFEECFRIYEGTALKLEASGACKGVRSAFGDGLLRANNIKSYKDKAWALRDTFDGMIRVSAMWCNAHQPTCPERIKAFLPNKP
ncbi:MAG: peptidase and chymotrypsin/Hap [Myxococcales bacterium]|nr:peptidase and chymotrypsin/Hap [Myxococcales bacterium]